MIPHEWIISHRCSWMAVYVFCRNARSKPHSDPHDVCTLSLLYQLTNCNLFTQHALFILWRDTTSELWTPVQFSLHSFTVLLLLTLFTFLHTIIILPLDTLIPLFTANRWDWQPHHMLGAKYLFVLCKFHIAVGGRHANKQLIWCPCPECHEASKHDLLKFGFLLPVRLNLGFITEGRPTAVLIIPSSWGFQRAVTYKPSAGLPGSCWPN
jgi:hypothetical protein